MPSNTGFEPKALIYKYLYSNENYGANNCFHSGTVAGHWGITPFACQDRGLRGRCD